MPANIGLVPAVLISIATTLYENDCVFGNTLAAIS
jgi:hypothetical protein